jgi:hypothetical protein
MWGQALGFAACFGIAPPIRTELRGQLITLRLAADSVQAQRTTSGAEARVRFIARNVSTATVYGVDECPDSPLYWVERLETDSSGHGTWHYVYWPRCYGGERPKELRSADSVEFSSRIVERIGERFFGRRPDVFRFVYSVRAAPHAESERVVSPPVVIRPPD